MKQLFTDTEFNNAKPYDKLPCQCKQCGNTFYLPKKRIQDILNPNKPDLGDFCSMECWGLSEQQRNVTICANCGVSIMRTPSQQKQSKSDRSFCSKSCAAVYNNTHKTKGTRRSKLEKYLETELTSLYPHIEFHFNRKDAINAELDIYIPALRLAFELNGIFHYEPIYGTEKLQQIQTNDQRKFQACIEQGIEMCIIDTSSLKYFKPERAHHFLDLIKNIINIKQ